MTPSSFDPRALELEMKKGRSSEFQHRISPAGEPPQSGASGWRGSGMPLSGPQTDCSHGAEVNGRADIVVGGQVGQQDTKRA
jgi:hypothetical protein